MMIPRKRSRRNRSRNAPRRNHSAIGQVSEFLEERALLSAVNPIEDPIAPTDFPDTGGQDEEFLLVGISESQVGVSFDPVLANVSPSFLHSVEALGLKSSTLASRLNIRTDTGILLTRWQVNPGVSSDQVMQELDQWPGIVYAEPDYHVSILATPNDPRFDELWGLHNTGQTGGVADADIDAVEAWDRSVGDMSTVIGVVDTGVDYTHPDLYLNMWVNQGEIPSGSGAVDTDGDGVITLRDMNHSSNSGVVSDSNSNNYIDGGDLLAAWGNGTDSDSNGWTDDLLGWDFVNGDNDPYDDHDHGTHVAGTIAAQANNSVGVVGVNWNAQIMGLKFLSSSGGGSLSGAVAALTYARQMGAHLTNNSWGGGGFSSTLKNEIDAHAQADMLFVAAAGNSAANNDASPAYPASYDSANIISVAASTHQDQLAYFSSYGATSVDLAAPGLDIVSTVPGGYASFSGTSMASPHVAGVAGLVRSVAPTASFATIRDTILDNVDPVSAFAGITLTGGRLNANNALQSLGGGDSGVSLDRSLYGSTHNEVRITVLDENAPSATPLTVQITVTDSGGMTVDTESLDLTSSETSLFDATIPVDPVGGSDSLQLVHDGTITVVYVDADSDGNGTPETLTDSAGIDLVGPNISGLEVTVGSTMAVLTWTTDELASSKVEFGLFSDQLDQSAADLTPKTSHEIGIRNLLPDTTYYYRVKSEDAAGNPASDNEVRSFTTSSRSLVLLVDDDNNYGTESYLTAAVEGAGYAYDIWDVHATGSSPQSSDLANYDLVVWFSSGEVYGNVASGLSLTEQSAIAGYLDIGGRLFLTGQNIVSNELDFGFMSGYLGVDGYVPNVGLWASQGVPEDPVSDGMQLMMDMPPQFIWNEADSVVPGPSAVGILDTLVTDGPAAEFAAVRTENETSDSRVVLFAFEFASIENMESPSNRTAVMGRVLEWLSGNAGGTQPGILVNPTSGLETTESGGQAQFNVVLTTEPSADVTIPVATSDASEATAGVAELVFTSANWSIPQSVVLTGVDDTEVDGDVSYTVQLGAATSADLEYDGLDPADVSAVNLDDDVAPLQMETGVLDGLTSGNWITVPLDRTYASPVVVVTLNSSAGNAPLAARVRQAAGSQFEMQIVRLDSGSTAIGNLSAHYVVVEEGVYTTDDHGVQMEAVRFDSTVTDRKGSWSGQSRAYQNVYSAPVVVGQVLSANDARQSRFWARGATVNSVPTANSLFVGKHVGEDPVTNRVTESIGYLVFEAGMHQLDNLTWNAGVGADTVQGTDNAPPYLYQFAEVTNASVGILSSAGMDGGDGGTPILFGSNAVQATQVGMAIEEDQLSDGERSHTTEQVAYVVFGYSGPVPGVTITPSGGGTAVSEDGVTDDYQVVLDTQPAAPVTITLQPDAQVATGGTTELVFSPTNWSQPQTVSVSAVNDAVAEGLHSGTIAHSVSSTDTGYNGIGVDPLVATITDNDQAGVLVQVSGAGTNVSEDGAVDDYTIVLTSQPVANVTVTVSGDGQLQSSPGNVVFTAQNWNQPQTVQVLAVDDAIAEGQHTGRLSHTVQSSDVQYDGRSVDSVDAQIIDNDSAGVVVSISNGSTAVSEAGMTDDYTVVLTSQPVASVSIEVTGGTQLQAGSTTLVFTASNWNNPQTVTVAAVDDDVAEGTHSGAISHAASSNDPTYDQIAVDGVTATIEDNDVAGFTVSESDGSTRVAEGGNSDTYTIVLTSQPIAPVTVQLNPDSQVATDASSLVFSDQNWNQPQTVTVSAVDDSAVEGEHAGMVSHSVSSSDAGYGGAALDSVAVTIDDNDIPGVVVTPTGGSTTVSEDGATDSYDVVLQTAPSANVTVSISTGGEAVTSVSSLTFTPTDWNQARTVVVSAVNDDVAEGTHADQVQHAVSSADSDYQGVAADSVPVTIIDNDTAGVAIFETGGGTAVTEGGASDTYDVVLTSQPLAAVQISLSNNGQVTTSPSTLSFDATNWNLRQTVTVSAVDDSQVEGTHQDQITATVTSSDAGYNGTGVPTVDVQITDNDQPVSDGLKFETGEILLTTADGWVTIGLTQSYDSMVVIATIGYDGYSNNPMVSRVRNASGSQFELQLQFATSGSFGMANVQYIVVEEGIYNQADHGISLEAVRFDSSRTDRRGSWVGEARSYQQSYASPVVVGQVMSANDPDWSVFWSRGSSRSTAPNGSLYVGKHVGEDTDQTRLNETVGYLVIESGMGVVDNYMYQAYVGQDIVRGVGNAPPYTYSLGSFGVPETAIVSQTGMDGGDGGWAILTDYSNTSDRLELAIEEDQWNDAERRHTTEQVAYLVLRPSFMTAPPLGARSFAVESGESLEANSSETGPMAPQRGLINMPVSSNSGRSAQMQASGRIETPRQRARQNAVSLSAIVPTVVAPPSSSDSLDWLFDRGNGSFQDELLGNWR